MQYYITVNEKSGKLIGTGLYSIQSQIAIPTKSLPIERTIYDTVENTSDYPQRIIVYKQHDKIIDIVCISGDSMVSAQITKVEDKP